MYVVIMSNIQLLYIFIVVTQDTKLESIEHLDKAGGLYM